MKTALLVALVVVSCVASSALASQYSFSGNASVSDPDGTLSFRQTQFLNFELLKFAAYQSINVQLTHQGDETDLTLDTLAGFVSYNKIPGGLLSYFSGTLDLNPDSFAANTCTYALAPSSCTFFVTHCASPEQKQA